MLEPLQKVVVGFRSAAFILQTQCLIEVFSTVETASGAVRWRYRDISSPVRPVGSRTSTVQMRGLVIGSLVDWQASSPWFFALASCYWLATFAQHLRRASH